MVCEYYFEDNYVHHQLGFKKALKLTEFYKTYSSSNKSISNLINFEIINDKLLHLILKKCLLVDLNLEQYLRRLRKKLLKKLLLERDSHFFLKYNFFLIAFAEQCFLNEFIYSESEEEISLLSTLEKKIKKEKNYVKLVL